MSDGTSEKPQAFPADKWGVGQPQGALLDAWGREIHETFGGYAYLVGSACFTKAWRDVDVRLMLDDDEFDHLFAVPVVDGPTGARVRVAGWSNPFLRGLNVAFSEWGRRATGLPIDFQIQRTTEANAEFRGPRCAIGISPIAQYAPVWRKRR